MREWRILAREKDNKLELYIGYYEDDKFFACETLPVKEKKEGDEIIPTLVINDIKRIKEDLYKMGDIKDFSVFYKD